MTTNIAGASGHNRDVGRLPVAVAVSSSTAQLVTSTILEDDVFDDPDNARGATTDASDAQSEVGSTLSAWYSRILRGAGYSNQEVGMAVSELRDDALREEAHTAASEESGDIGSVATETEEQRCFHPYEGLMMRGFHLDQVGTESAASNGVEERMERIEINVCVKRFLLVFAATLAAIAVAVAVSVSLARPKYLAASNNMQASAPTGYPTQSPLPPTSAPTAVLLPEFLQILLPVSGESVLEAGTPANKALEWIINEDPLRRGHDDPRFVQRYILGVLYYAASGGKWRGCGSLKPRFCEPKPFFSSSDECIWHGITCRNGTVVDIDQADKNLAGTIPSELALLPELESLSLHRNNLAGTIPTELGRLKKFHTLVVNNNRLQSPFPVELLEKGLMQTIRVAENEFSEPLPVVTSLTELKVLSVSNNNFSGQIDPMFGEMTKLKVLNLGQNRFTGAIPSSLAAIPTLENFNIDENHFVGLFPAVIFGMKGLKHLVISNNEFTGTISHNIQYMGSSLEGRHQKTVNMANNLLHGTIPLEVGNIIDLMSSLA